MSGWTGNKDSAWLNALPWPAKQADKPEDWSEKKKQTAFEQYPRSLPDPANGIDIHGKPVFDATWSHKFQASEKEMTDLEQLNFRQYQLWKTTMKIDRRDSIYETFATSDVTNNSMQHNWLGAPFPIIEPRPTMPDMLYTVRWYEHATSLLCTGFFWTWLRAKPSMRYGGGTIGAQRIFIPFSFVGCEFFFMWRAACRLRGTFENEYECERFGVLETPQRLAEKAKYWEKYRRFKEEWCKRYDYYVLGLRPGERWTLFSPCHASPAAVLFNRRTDYPLRKNPMLLVEAPMTPTERRSAMDFFERSETPRPPQPSDIERPENKYYGPEGPNEVRLPGQHRRGVKHGGLFT